MNRDLEHQINLYDKLEEKYCDSLARVRELEYLQEKHWKLRSNWVYFVEQVSDDELMVTRNHGKWTDSVRIQWWDFETLLDALFIKTIDVTRD